MADDPTFKSKIVVNGREVGVEDVPAMLRKFVEDKDNNGIPDFMDQMFKNPLLKMVLGKAGAQLQSQLANIKDLTPEQRQKIDLLMQKLGGIAGTSGAQQPSVVMTSVSGQSTDFLGKPSVKMSPSSSGGIQIDYKKLGIEDPDQKKPFPVFLVAALLVGLVVLAAVFLLRG